MSMLIFSTFLLIAVDLRFFLLTVKKELPFCTKIVLRFLKNKITWARILKWHLDTKKSSINPNF